MTSRLKIGVLVTHYPAGCDSLSDLVERDVFPSTALDPDFRVGMIVEKKSEDHWLIYQGNEKAMAWYTTEELRLLS
jgi:hypothetical protein